MDALVTVVTANYNAEHFVAETIESVLAQTYRNWEMIIVDDCSTDRSLNIINYYLKKDSRIRLIKLEKNGGPAVARNRAIEEAKGRYIAFLDSDDLWMPDKLEKQIAYMEQNSVVFSYGAYDLIDEGGETLGHFSIPQKLGYSDLLKTCPIGCLTAVYDTEAFGKVTMPLIRKRQDYGLWLKLLKKTDYAYGINETLAIYRVRKNSVSSNKLKAAQYQWKIYRDVEKLGLSRSLYYFMHYAVNGLLKYR